MLNVFIVHKELDNLTTAIIKKRLKKAGNMSKNGVDNKIKSFDKNLPSIKTEYLKSQEKLISRFCFFFNKFLILFLSNLQTQLLNSKK